mmetsp:Transcript_12669/g.40737  ORF Transcript_12669/g.40737 Transcript_12669/m.40737 type:complete len:232 (-) Transcript_12669:140-835(-)
MVLEEVLEGEEAEESHDDADERERRERLPDGLVVAVVVRGVVAPLEDALLRRRVPAAVHLAQPLELGPRRGRDAPVEEIQLLDPARALGDGLVVDVVAVEHHEEAVGDRRDVVRALEVLREAPARDEERRAAQHQGFAERHVGQELAEILLEAHHPVGHRRVAAAGDEVARQLRDAARVEERRRAVQPRGVLALVEVPLLREEQDDVEGDEGHEQHGEGHGADAVLHRLLA